MLLLYTILLYLATPLILIRMYWRSRRNRAYQNNWRQRFGHIKKISSAHSIWVHAVSLGEARAAIPLINTLIHHYPEHTLIVTTTTPTGSAEIKRQLGDQVYHVYIPYDLPHVIRRFLKRARPCKVIIMETELWPNLLSQLKRAAIPVMIANARLSERSFRGYQRLARFIKPLLQSIAIIGAQSQQDAQRFIALGAKKDHITVLGNIKFDQEIPTGLIEQAKNLRKTIGSRPTWVAASTHAGEDEILLDAFKRVREKYSSALLILAPRHPERFDSVASLAKQRGFSLCRRSSKALPNHEADIYLADTLGELMLFYAASDIAFVAGSLKPIGGHNLIEPACLSLPILTGPHLHNFSSVAERLTDANAIRICDDAESISASIVDLLDSPEQANQLGARALSVSELNRGAIQKHLKYIANL